MKTGRRTDAYLCSYPKSGRTWLRFIIAHYFNLLFELGLRIDFHTVFTVVPNDEDHPKRGLPAFAYGDRDDVPLVVATHALPSPAITGPVLFLYRSPADTIVSYYFHQARQWHDYGGSLGEFIRDPTLGVENFIRYMNEWAAELPRHPGLTLSYEELTAEPEATVARVVSFLGLPLVPSALRRAIESSAFDQMQQLEREGGIPGHRYDRADVDSLRVRRGEVGGHRRHLETSDRKHIDSECAAGLSPAARRLLATPEAGPS